MNHTPYTADMNEHTSTEHVTVIPAKLYDELMQDTAPQPDDHLRQVANRARQIIHKKA